MLAPLLLPKLLSTTALLLLVLIFSHKTPLALESFFLPTTTSSITTRLANSESLFQKSLQKRKELFARHNSSKQELFPAKSIPTYFTTPWTVWDFFPPAFNCPHEMERLGRLGDGGKWVCGMSAYEKVREEECVVYSFGIQNETSFEEEWLGRTGCEVWGYDFSVDGVYGLEKYGERFKFSKAGISEGKTTVDKNGIEFWSISDLMRRNGHEYVDVMKMDIEGYEFGALKTLVEDVGVLPFGQLQVEIHLGDERTLPGLMGWWEELERVGLRAVWMEVNLLIVTGGGWDGMPRYAEYTFINVNHPRNVLLRD